MSRGLGDVYKRQVKYIMSISKKFFEKHMLIHYVLSAFFKALLVSVLFFAVLFASLQITGKYTAVENMLDLKYDSPWIIGPLLIAATLAVLSFIVGMILYLYKYKRNSYKGEFYKALAGALNENIKQGR